MKLGCQAGFKKAHAQLSLTSADWDAVQSQVQRVLLLQLVPRKQIPGYLLIVSSTESGANWTTMLPFQTSGNSRQAWDPSP